MHLDEKVNWTEQGSEEDILEDSAASTAALAVVKG